MKRYIALLRGVNISGKNRVPMAELKKGFEALGFSEVKTWLNSGNVVFSVEEADAAELAGRIERMIRHGFGLDIYREIGEPKEGLEQIQEYRSAVFWSFSRKDYQKTNWWPRTARADIGSKLTIRTANTVRKIVRIGKAL